VLTRVNGEVRQDESVTDLIFDCGQIIEWLSNNMTLRKGTVILTGTPAGVGGGKEPAQYLQAGDVVECEVPGIGVLSNKVVPAPAHALPSAL
jgi:2-keto-4-pentenoate hydratase/2-oxohepta-3-ene-1,7-dioic acid hydratase in catechol pathway